MTNVSLFYMDLVNACHIGHNRQIEQCLRCFVIIFQTTKATNYMCEMMYMVAYFKKL